MDTSRLIEYLEIEFDTSSNFDDLYIKYYSEIFCCQMKDFKSVELKDLVIEDDRIIINGKDHKLSDHTNILFFKNINIIPNDNILNIPALKIGNVYIISLSREEAKNIITELYEHNEFRELEINSFFEKCMDDRDRIIKKIDLPIIHIYRKELYERTVKVGSIPDLDTNELLITGKPGIGKSHLVNVVIDNYERTLLYRFWISNQDINYEDRLKYNNFIFDLSKQLFHDQDYRTETEIISKINEDNLVTIIDGLDHVENYNNKDLYKFLNFFDHLKSKNRIIILSRPLKAELKYNTIQLSEWTDIQTYTVLEDLYHITDINIKIKIFELTKGYPLLVRYISEHYKKFNSIPDIDCINDLDDYYSKIIERLDSKKTLTLFLTNHSFFMRSEIYNLLGEEISEIIFDIIKSHPYLFEIQLNRISLFHDSFINFLKKDNLNILKKQKEINKKVKESILNLDIRYLSRYSYFKFEKSDKLEIIQKYSSMNSFKVILKNTIDFEAIRAFYMQLHESLTQIEYNKLSIISYYNLSLIMNIVIRDHLSSLHEFYYNIVKSFIYNGFIEDDITSSGYLFSMYTYVKKKNPIPLHKVTCSDLYNTDNFFEELKNKIYEEDNYFYDDDFKIREKKFIEIMTAENEYESRKILVYVLSRIHNIKVCGSILKKLKEIINLYISNKKNKAIYSLKGILDGLNFKTFYSERILEEARDNIASQGINFPHNEYIHKSLKEIIIEYNKHGSFFLWPKILNKIRLDLERNISTSLNDLSLFFPMYHNRKDVTVISVSDALTVFERFNFIDYENSCKIIQHIQSMSEKGIRYIFNDYITLHHPKIIKTIENSFDIDDLQIYWFDLPAKYIDVYSNKIFESAMKSLLRRTSYHKKVEIGSLKNLIKSNRWSEVKEILEYFKYTIEMKNDNIFLSLIRDETNLAIEFIRDDDSNMKIDSAEHYKNGYLSKDDVQFIIDHKLSPTEIAKYPDGWYSTLSDISLYDIFDKNDVTDNFHQIIYNALTGKVKSYNSFAHLYHFIGNIPLLEEKYNDGKRIKEMFNSFLDFLEISFINEWNINRQ